MNRIYRFLPALLLCGSTVFAADWPQWRGPERDGHVPAGVAVPATLPQPPVVVWHVPVGFAISSPVVSGGKVFHLDSQDDKETVHAVEAATGRTLWSHPLDDLHKDSQSAAGPRCTPVVDDDRVYAQSCRGELQCLAAVDGQMIWQTSYVKDFGAVFIGEKGKAAGASRHGNSGSPIIDGDHLIACVGGADGAAIVCFEKKSGKVIWKSQNETPGYSAPVIATIGGIKQLVCFTAESVLAVDLKAGALLWRVPVKTSLGRNVTTPVVVDDTVVVASYQAGLLGLKVKRDGDAFKAEQAWATKDSAINFSSPVTAGDHLYGAGPAKNIVCVDVASGKQAWSEPGYFSGGAGSIHAGFIVMGPNVLALTDGGQLVLFAADPKEFHLIGKSQVCGTNWCNPAYADGKLYLRDAHELYCVQVLP